MYITCNDDLTNIHSTRVLLFRLHNTLDIIKTVEINGTHWLSHIIVCIRQTNS